MRTYLILAVAIALLATCTPAVQGQSAADEAAIRHVIQQGFALANKHDAKAYFETLCTENFENHAGTRKGRAANIEYFSDLWAREKNIQYKQLEEIGIFFVTPDVAVLKSRNETSGAMDEDENGRWTVAWVLAKRDGEWRLATSASWGIEQ